MKKMLITGLFASLICACGGSSNEKKEVPPAPAETAAAPSANAESTDKGVGKFTNVEVGATLDVKMAELGSKIYDVKCGSCHKLTGERLVGPGWKGVTGRRRPEWIMNFVTNVDEMLDKDALAQSQLEVCLVRMPNQNLTDDDARHVYEFMRKNDGIK